MPRVTEAEVAVVTQIDPTSAILTMAISVATLVVDESLTSTLLTTARKKQIELFLAAHFAELSNNAGPLAAEEIGSASEKYHNIYAAGLRATRFGQQAIALDISSALAQIADRVENPGKKEALFTVVGTPPTQDSYYLQWFGHLL